MRAFKGTSGADTPWGFLVDGEGETMVTSAGVGMIGCCAGRRKSEAVWELLETLGMKVVCGKGVESFVIGIMAGSLVVVVEEVEWMRV